MSSSFPLLLSSHSPFSPAPSLHLTLFPRHLNSFLPSLTLPPPPLFFPSSSTNWSISLLQLNCVPVTAAIPKRAELTIMSYGNLLTTAYLSFHALTLLALYGAEVCTLPLVLSSDTVHSVWGRGVRMLCMGKRYYLLTLSTLCTLPLVLYSGPVHSVWGRDVCSAWERGSSF